jgi:hypothetical protein
VAVAERVIALSTLLFRRQLEHAEGCKVVASKLSEFEAWLGHSVVAGALSPEAELINQPQGSWTLQQAVDAGWRLEALGCLLRAISQLDEMPAYDKPFSLGELLHRSNFLGAPEQLIAEAMLRPQTELDRARSLAETWHWRDRTAQLVRAGRTLPPGSPPVSEIIGVTARAAHDRGDIPPPVDDDFPVFGKAYRLLSDEERSLVGSIARERHYAFNWLCGYAPDWDNVRTDT